MPDSAAEPLLPDDRLEGLDHGLFDDGVDPIVAQPVARPLDLVVPKLRGGWQRLPQDNVPTDPIVELLGDAGLEDLERGLAQDEDAGTNDFVVTPPSRTIHTLLPEGGGQRPEVLPQAPTRLFSADAVGGWVVGACLVLLVMTGAAGAAFTFHERLAAVVVQWAPRLK